MYLRNLLTPEFNQTCNRYDYLQITNKCFFMSIDNNDKSK